MDKDKVFASSLISIVAIFCPITVIAMMAMSGMQFIMEDGVPAMLKFEVIMGLIGILMSIVALIILIILMVKAKRNKHVASKKKALIITAMVFQVILVLTNTFTGLFGIEFVNLMMGGSGDPSYSIMMGLIYYVPAFLVAVVHLSAFILNLVALINARREVEIEA